MWVIHSVLKTFSGRDMPEFGRSMTGKLGGFCMGVGQHA